MIVQVRFDYGIHKKIEALSNEDYHMLRVGVSQLKLPEDRSKANMAFYHEHLLDLTTDGPLLDHLGIEFTVVKFKNTYIANRGEQRESHIHIAIPNVGLLAVDEVTVLEDSCTDFLQDHLDKGWRILAVCPPNAARRPDYVLCRTKQAK